MNKRFVFRHYWWIAMVAAVAVIGVILAFERRNAESLMPTTSGGVLAFCYFVQKQKLDELRFFKELFTDFNRRYDDMNEALEHIRAENLGGDAESRETLVDYFNLCAEEYLFFDEGYIHPMARRSWCRGMSYYLKNEGIRQVWDSEVTFDSYYSLTKGKIDEGAALKGRSR